MVETTTAARQFERVCEILEENHHSSARIIPILQAIQEAYRYLPEEILTYVATSLNVPPAHIYGVATFYAHFTLEPKGKYVIKLCDGTACHVKHSIPILDALREHLKLPAGTETTPDMLFTVETVSCLGACGLAPVMLINEKVYGQMTPEKAVDALKEVIASEAEATEGASE